MSDLVGLLRKKTCVVAQDRSPEGITHIYGPDPTCIAAANRITSLENACKALCISAGTVMRYLEEDGPKVVPHLVDSDDNPGQRTRDDIAATLKLIGY